MRQGVKLNRAVYTRSASLLEPSRSPPRGQLWLARGFVYSVHWSLLSDSPEAEQETAGPRTFIHRPIDRYSITRASPQGERALFGFICVCTDVSLTSKARADYTAGEIHRKIPSCWIFYYFLFRELVISFIYSLRIELLGYITSRGNDLNWLF